MHPSELEGALYRVDNEGYRTPFVCINARRQDQRHGCAPHPASIDRGTWRDWPARTLRGPPQGFPSSKNLALRGKTHYYL